MYKRQEEIRAALDAGAMDAAEAQCIDLSDENGFFSWLLNFPYEQGAMEERQADRSRAMQELGNMFDNEVAETDGGRGAASKSIPFNFSIISV